MVNICVVVIFKILGLFKYVEKTATAFSDPIEEPADKILRKKYTHKGASDAVHYCNGFPGDDFLFFFGCILASLYIELLK